MNWIEHFEQMNVDKILRLRKKIVAQLAFYWGKINIVIIRLFVKLEKQKHSSTGFKEKK